MRVPFIVLLLINTLFHTARPQNATSCVAGIYNVGSKASVTCLFHDATKEQKNGVVVTKHSMTASKESTEEDVGTCHFKKNTEPQCSTRDGSYYFNITKHSMKIEIPQVSSQHEGRYACQVVPGDGITVYECLLVVKGASQPNNVNDVRDSSGSEKPESLHGHMKAALALLVILILLVVGVIMFFVLVYKKKWFMFKRKDGIKQTEEEKPIVPIEETDDGEQFSVGFRPDKPGKDAVKPNKDEQNAMLEKGESGRSGTLTDGSRLITQETTQNPIFNNSSTTPSPSGELDKPLLTKEDTDPQDSRSGREDDQKEDDAAEKKVETKKEREAREKAEEKARKAELKVKLENAETKEDKKLIQKAFDDEEKRLKRQKADEENLKRQKEDEEKRLKRQKGDEEKARKNSKKGKK